MLSPAGDFESLKAAVLYGADAVYLGSTMFGMRCSAAKFDFNLLEVAVSFAHKNDVKLYLTCNTIPSNDDIFYLKNFLQNAQEIGVDGLIVADLGVFMSAKKYASKIPLHVSTQFGVFNFKTAQALYELGAKRVVLARELSVDDVKTIRKNVDNNLEIECFVHGAMCVSISGRCLISQYLLGRDANRGNCAQPCRWSYELIEKTRPNDVFDFVENDRGSYILNSKDLNLINRLAVLKQAGVLSFKIEGRAKSAYYVGVVTNAYRMAIDELLQCDDEANFQVSDWIKNELEKVSHRPYFEGFLFNNPGFCGIKSQNYRTGGYVRNCDVVAVVENISDDLLSCIQKNKFSVGDCLEIVIPKQKIFKFVVKQLFNANCQEIETAPHAQMKVFVKGIFDFDLNKFNLGGCFLRRDLK